MATTRGSRIVARLNWSRARQAEVEELLKVTSVAEPEEGDEESKSRLANEKSELEILLEEAVVNRKFATDDFNQLVTDQVILGAEISSIQVALEKMQGNKKYLDQEVSLVRMSGAI